MNRAPITAANGQRDDAFIHDLKIELFAKPMTIQVAFCPAWAAGRQNLLGMQGFFGQMIAGFDHRNRKFFYLL